MADVLPDHAIELLSIGIMSYQHTGLMLPLFLLKESKGAQR